MPAANRVILPKLPRGEGTFYYTEKGTISYKKYIRLSDGSIVRKSVNGTTVMECLNRMMDIEKKLVKYGHEIGRNGKFRDEIYYWLENVKSNTLKTQSYIRLESTVRNHIVTSNIGKKRILNISTKDLQNMINGLNTGDYSYSTIKKVFDCLNDFFRYLSLRDGINNPMLAVTCMRKDIVIKEVKEVEYLDDEDIKKFKVQASSCWESSGRPRYRYGAVLVANLYMGLRIGELLALRWRDVNFTEKYVYVNKTLIEETNPKFDKSNIPEMLEKDIKKHIFRVQQSTKTNKNRKVPINNTALYYLKMHYENTDYKKPGDFVISTRNGKNSTPKNIQDTLRYILKNADIKIDSSNTHIMRHTCASLLYRRGIDLHTIAKILGNSEEVLRKTYVHFNDEDLSMIMEMSADIE